MDREKFSFLAHRECWACNPLSPATVDRALAMMRVADGARVLDLGAGRADVLDYWSISTGVFGDAVDKSPWMARAGRARAQHNARIAFHESDAAAFLDSRPLERWGAAICLGSSHALGGLRPTLERLHRVIRPSGTLLLGEPYWKRDPAPAFLEALGATPSTHDTHDANIQTAVAAGWTPISDTTASDQELRDYEAAYSRAIETYATQNPTEPDVPAMLARSRAWRALSLAHGLETLGFGVYVLLRS